MARIGVLTGGGDCPGLNAVIRAIVRKGINAYGHEFVGFRYGWAGVLDERRRSTSRTRARAGSCTAAGRSSAPRARTRTRWRTALEQVQRRRSQAARLDALIPIGGEDTLGVAGKLADDGINVVGVPKTIDNDLAGDRLHVRLPDRGADRHRRDRPPAHDGRVAQPRDRRRGDGPPRGLDRRLLRAWPAAPT